MTYKELHPLCNQALLRNVFTNKFRIVESVNNKDSAWGRK